MLRPTPFSFRLEGTEGSARAGTFQTPHGPVRTPAFMPVGTQGTVKTLTPEEVEALGASMVLANTYHLFLRPGHELVRELGGLHDFMRWEGPSSPTPGGSRSFPWPGSTRSRMKGWSSRATSMGPDTSSRPKG